MALTRIIAVVVDTTRLTAYKPDGSVIEVPQGDPRVFTLLDALPKIEKHGFAMIELGRDNPYRDFEKKSGLVRFFKIAKQKVSHLFGADEPPVVPTGITGRVPVSEESLPEQRPYSHSEAVSDIMAHAESVTADSFNPDMMTENDTIVAITDESIIPHAEQLEDQLRHSAKVGSTKGMEAFYRRIGKVIGHRGHSIEDLLKFMEKNDLPIADDGSLIVYKVLSKQKGVYVDCHTRKVTQKIGSFVCMDEKLVDPNRRQECSNGLHVARRGYIGNFSGDVCTIVKVAPEDVIAVPVRDPDKVRVCGYHILMELDQEAWDKLKRNVPITDNPKCQKMLGRAMSGDHVAVIEIVKIGGQMGTNVTVTPVGKIDKAGKPVEVRKAVAVDDPSIKKATTVINKDKVAKQMSDVVKTTSSRQTQAAILVEVIESTSDVGHRFAAALDLLNLKRSSKVSWATLGLSEEQAKKILDISINQPVSAPDPVKETVKETAKPTVKPVAIHPNSTRDRISSLAELVLDPDTSTSGRVTAARELLDHRRKVKKSWTSIGRPDLNDEYLRTIVNSHIDVAPPKKVSSNVPPKKKAPPREPYTGSRIQQARAMYEAQDWVTLNTLKRRARMSWEKLGFTTIEITQIKLHSGD